MDIRDHAAKVGCSTLTTGVLGHRHNNPHGIPGLHGPADLTQDMFNEATLLDWRFPVGEWNARPSHPHPTVFTVTHIQTSTQPNGQNALVVRGKKTAFLSPNEQGSTSPGA